MGDRSGRAHGQGRQAVAQLAAQLLMQDGTLSLGAARRKAAARLGISGRQLPELAEIEAALIEHQRLFGGEEHAAHLHRLREQAVSAMQFLANFEPRLVGPVYSGTAGPHSGITLHVFADTVEEVLLFLDERDVPATLGERRYRDAGVHPRVSFIAGDDSIDLIVFPPSQRHQAPLSELTGRPMVRADIEAVRALLAASSLTMRPR
jgi:hypothetical protein